MNIRLLRSMPLCLLLPLLALAGCKTSLTLQPTPEILKDERFDLFEANPDPLQSNRIETLYATTRVPGNDAEHYGGGHDGRMHLGYGISRVGDEDAALAEIVEQSTTAERTREFSWTLLEAPRLASVPDADEPASATPSAASLSTEQQRYFELLNGYIASSEIKDLTIYVHGAKQTFIRAVNRGAQFQYFTGNNARVLTFAWPADLLNYGSDKAQSDASARELAALIELLAQHSDAQRIHLLAYSSGGRATGRALGMLGERHEDPADLRLGQVYLAQSDQPLNDFITALPTFYPLLEGLTVTYADRDPILKLAQLTDGQLRLGAAGEEADPAFELPAAELAELVRIFNADNTAIIDLRQVSQDDYQFNHGAWYANPWVSTDVLVTLLGGLEADERGLVSVPSEGVDIWTFPADYIERLGAALLTEHGAD